MKQEQIPPPTIIETLPDLEWLAGHMAGAKRLSVDLESDGFYVYYEKVCLLQVSSETEDFVIDPLAVKDLSPLSSLFRDPEVEKVFHAGEYDILCLKRDYGFRIRNVFDTMAASRILGAERLGLAALIEQRFGVHLSKKLQRANWGRRPLTPEQIEYARLDTHYLLRLRDMLHAELQERGLLAEAQDEFRRLENLQPAERTFDPGAYWRLPGAKDLPAQKRTVLKALYLFREKKAAELDRAPFRVLPEDLLLRLAEAVPATREALRSVRGMTPYLLRAFGPELLREILEGLQAPPEESPPPRPPRRQWDGDTLRRYESLRQWRKEAAAKRGVNSVVILGTEEIRGLAEAPKEGGAPETWLECLTEYKREAYGEEILQILQTPAPAPAGGSGRKRRRRRRRPKAAPDAQ